MLKKSLILLTIPYMLNAITITNLLDSLQKRPEYKLDEIMVDKSVLGKQSLNDKLMPTVYLYAGYEMYNSPNGMLPVAPNKLIKMVKDQKIPQPFSKQIAKEGVEFTWPLFIKSIYTLKNKADLLHMASKEKKRLNLLQREALVVGAVAQLRYLEALKMALLSKKHSILKTKQLTSLKVKDGRLPPSALMVLNNHINDLDIGLNNLEQNINTLKSKIETLTGIYLKKAINIKQKHQIKKGEIFALKALKLNLKAQQQAIKASKEAYYPSIVTKGRFTYSQADAYNNNKSVSEHFGDIGVYLNMPLFDATKSTQIQKAKLSYMQERLHLEQTKHLLKIKAKELQKEIRILNKSISLAQKSVVNQKKLLKIAKVAFVNHRMSEEEYLRYEDALANAKASLYSFRAKKIQDIAQLAVIYGNDLKRIVK
jgi:outer membrane protein TolC